MKILNNMKTYFDVDEIASLKLEDGFLFVKLIINYKNGKKEVIRRYNDIYNTAYYELENLYDNLLKKINKRKCQGK